METKRNTSSGEKEEEEEDDDELLKTRISAHPLYGRLVENHLNCLKVLLSPSTYVSLCVSFEQF